ncbi:alpha/beta fold hydrolase [Chitinibacter tainanensis]|uniref:alpha/beta fold hydrolase n=1 Tax=Chitinibacter tainanensis TaxID=230667 RepID=UPI000423000F|nr:alpha/beta hydrolase [Chitinibacter tainanensis]
MSHTWVLLRGLMREARHWGDWPARLQARYPQDRIICPDWPGCGQHYQQRSLLRIEDMAGYLQQTLIQQGASGPYRVVAISLGAMVACAWAQQRPADFIDCTLINPSLRGYSPPWQRLRLANWPRLLGLLGQSPAAREATILALTSQLAEPAVLAAWQAWAREAPVSRANALRQLWAAARFRPAAQTPAVPLQIIQGLADQLVDPRCASVLAQAWNCPLRSHPTAGHDLPLDAPEWLLAQLGAAPA